MSAYEWEQNKLPKTASSNESTRPMSTDTSVRGLNGSTASRTNKAGPPSQYESMLVAGLRGLEIEQFRDRCAARHAACVSGGGDLNEIEVSMTSTCMTLTRSQSPDLNLSIQMNFPGPTHTFSLFHFYVTQRLY
jgi:hypothetical protein